MARYQVILAYDGTDFNGFQRQANHANIRTVQGVVESALHSIGWEGQSIKAAGRTDTGVHASGQVIAFDFEWNHSTGDLMAAMNANFPHDVSALEVKLAQPDFHPRFDAVARCYHYFVYTQNVRNPLLERYAWRVYPPVDINRLRSAAMLIIGEHDFAAFGTALTMDGSTIRRVYSADWVSKTNGLVFQIKANAFLYHMVRRLVIFQVAIGQGKLELESMQEYLEQKNSPLVNGLAPPQGLTLIEVTY
jgi:tRNA pseudouridine38-40 synthase